MSANKSKSHILVLPEDDANRQMANGFLLTVNMTRQRQMQVLQPARGWRNVIELFKSDYVAGMEKYPTRLMVLLIDFDDEERRLEAVKDAVPPHLADRVFVLGALSEPEALRTELGSYEGIGSDMAKDCRNETDTTWGHSLLKHNAGELDRLRKHILPMLFQPI